MIIFCTLLKFMLHLAPSILLLILPYAPVSGLPQGGGGYRAYPQDLTFGQFPQYGAI
jgi:hypothetical protein